MSSKYALWLNYNNDKSKYRIPVNPEKIRLKVNGKVSTCDIDSFGTILHKGRRDAMTISWSSIFPAKYGSYCSCAANQFKTPNKMHKWMLALMEAKDPVHFVLTGGPMAVNIYAVITTYQSDEEGGDPGTLTYSVELREYRKVQVKTYKKPSVGGKPTVSSSSNTGNRPNNTQKPRTYKVKAGDCLWNIAKKYYGNGAKYTKIYNANRNKIKNPNLIYPGQVLTIP